jgi:hypothetical protein
MSNRKNAPIVNAVEQSPEFQELIATRRRFVLPATILRERPAAERGSSPGAAPPIGTSKGTSPPTPLTRSPRTPTPQYRFPSAALLLRSEGPRPTRAFVG